MSMPAVVEHDVDLRMLFNKSLPKSRIGLIADRHANPVCLVYSTRRLNVDAVDAGLVTEVVEPHSETAAAVDADFDHVDRLVDEPMKMAVVDVEVMAPFPDTGPLPQAVEVLLES